MSGSVDKVAVFQFGLFLDLVDECKAQLISRTHLHNSLVAYTHQPTQALKRELLGIARVHPTCRDKVHIDTGRMSSLLLFTYSVDYLLVNQSFTG